MNKKHLDQMRHAVGFFSEDPGYRNYYFCTATNRLWDNLAEAGYAGSQYQTDGTVMYWVTDSGKKLIGLEYQIDCIQRLKNKHERNLENIYEIHEIEID